MNLDRRPTVIHPLVNPNRKSGYIGKYDRRSGPTSKLFAERRKSKQLRMQAKLNLKRATATECCPRITLNRGLVKAVDNSSKFANISLLGNVQLENALYARATGNKVTVPFKVSIIRDQEFYKSLHDEISVGKLEAIYKNGLTTKFLPIKDCVVRIEKTDKVTENKIKMEYITSHLSQEFGKSNVAFGIKTDIFDCMVASVCVQVDSGRLSLKNKNLDFGVLYEHDDYTWIEVKADKAVIGYGRSQQDAMQVPLWKHIQKQGKSCSILAHLVMNFKYSSRKGFFLSYELVEGFSPDQG